MTAGHRVADGDVRALHDGAPGGYCKVKVRDRHEWWIKDPSGRVVRRTRDEVVEHDDGTITASTEGASIREGLWGRAA